MSTLDIYRRMLATYKAIKAGKASGRGYGPGAYPFDANELRAMLDSSRRPASVADAQSLSRP